MVTFLKKRKSVFGVLYERKAKHDPDIVKIAIVRICLETIETIGDEHIEKEKNVETFGDKHKEKEKNTIWEHISKNGIRYSLYVLSSIIVGIIKACADY